MQVHWTLNSKNRIKNQNILQYFNPSPYHHQRPNVLRVAQQTVAGNGQPLLSANRPHRRHGDAVHKVQLRRPEAVDHRRVGDDKVAVPADDTGVQPPVDPLLHEGNVQGDGLTRRKDLEKV